MTVMILWGCNRMFNILDPINFQYCWSTELLYLVCEVFSGEDLVSLVNNSLPLPFVIWVMVNKNSKLVMYESLSYPFDISNFFPEYLLAFSLQYFTNTALSMNQVTVE